MIEFSISAVPPSLNVWSRKHWSVRRREAARWRALVSTAARYEMRRRIPLRGFGPTSAPRFPITPAIVTLSFRLPRGGDASNREKFVTDGLIGTLIVDDGPPHLVELRLRSERGKPAETTVRVEEAQTTRSEHGQGDKEA